MNIKPLYEAAKQFVDAYEHEQRHGEQKRELPKTGEVYQDVFGYKYVIVSVLPASFGDKARVALARVSCNGDTVLTDIFTPTLEEFMNPTFEKYERD